MSDSTKIAELRSEADQLYTSLSNHKDLLLHLFSNTRIQTIEQLDFSLKSLLKVARHVHEDANDLKSNEGPLRKVLDEVLNSFRKAEQTVLEPLDDLQSLNEQVSLPGELCKFADITTGLENAESRKEELGRRIINLDATITQNSDKINRLEREVNDPLVSGAASIGDKIAGFGGAIGKVFGDDSYKDQPKLVDILRLLREKVDEAQTTITCYRGELREAAKEKGRLESVISEAENVKKGSLAELNTIGEHLKQSAKELIGNLLTLKDTCTQLAGKVEKIVGAAEGAVFTFEDKLLTATGILGVCRLSLIDLALEITVQNIVNELVSEYGGTQIPPEVPKGMEDVRKASMIAKTRLV